jgi:preprotein translocase subunit SecE
MLSHCPHTSPKAVCFFIGVKHMANPAKFMREVRQESKKVTWPTRKETTVSSAMVVVIALIAALFFLLVDSVVSWGVRTILSLG